MEGFGFKVYHDHQPLQIDMKLLMLRNSHSQVLHTLRDETKNLKIANDKRPSG